MPDFPRASRQSTGIRVGNFDQSCPDRSNSDATCPYENSPTTTTNTTEPTAHSLKKPRLKFIVASKNTVALCYSLRVNAKPPLKSRSPLPRPLLCPPRH